VAEIRDEVREVTSGRLEEIERAQQREVDRRVEEMRREMVLGMDRVRDELRREVERVKDGIDGWKKKVAAEVNRISLD
jgi:F0F1-type ATP synthase membrane subunit b/b'